ncbi:RNA polymerase sigma factor [Pseudorhodoferax soli]|uniref:RNA polymerase sigma-70 factor (ECF subfamily) n=1 Tax=Pseudorhodoferax soli TaxID=545864 RepID=A0A368XB07_9BURK|nr:RNA polymerase sigma factor [Pseudorhodoferax soli]RCW63204.1 RNA polymerase sigma-70 factor (ECF subfamily) [Pseudorhodoferax soli]
MFQTAESRYNLWVREHYRFLMRSAWALTGSRAAAEDIVQDCFAAAWRHRDQLRQAESARAWLFQIMRRNARRHFSPGNLSIDDEAVAEQPAPDCGMDDRLDVVKVLTRISPIHGEVLALYYFDDMSTSLMADALEVAPGTVLSRLARAREALREAMLAPRARPRDALATSVTPLRRA